MVRDHVDGRTGGKDPLASEASASHPEQSEGRPGEDLDVKADEPRPVAGKEPRSRDDDEPEGQCQHEPGQPDEGHRDETEDGAQDGDETAQPSLGGDRRAGVGASGAGLMGRSG